jgi:ribosomal protein L40E
MANAGNESKIDHFICRACGQKLPKDALSGADADENP